MVRAAVGTYRRYVIVVSFGKTPSLIYADPPEREDVSAGARSKPVHLSLPIYQGKWTEYKKHLERDYMVYQEVFQKTRRGERWRRQRNEGS